MPKAGRLAGWSAELLDARPVRRPSERGTILTMTSRPTTSKLLLVAEGRAAIDGGPAVPVRRYRLARIVAGNHGAAVKGRRGRRT
jgi:hypothetical protein